MITRREAATAASLDLVLAARDRRAASQRALLAGGHGFPLLSLTLVSPGPVKDSPGRRTLMDMAEIALSDEIRRADWPVRWHSRTDGPAGPEALWVVDASPTELKRLAITIEDSKPWGRLLDADVVVSGAGKEPMPLGREPLGFEPRRCLVCGGRAKECISARRHHSTVAAQTVAALIEQLTGKP